MTAWFLCCPQCGEKLLLEKRSVLLQHLTCQVVPEENMRINATYSKKSKFVKERIDRLFCPECDFEVQDVAELSPKEIVERYPNMVKDPDQREPFCYYYKDTQKMGGNISGINQ